MHVLSCHLGREDVLIAECGRLWPNAPAHCLADGWVAVPARITPPDNCAKATQTPISLAFATQVWPAAKPLVAPSIATWARAIAEHAIAEVAGETPWRLQLFARADGASAVSERRLALIEQGVWRFLKAKQRRLCRSHQAGATALWHTDNLIVSVAITQATQGFVSVVSPQMQRLWRPTLSRFAGGYVPIAADGRPPARAYRKLREALAHLALTPTAKQTWVDLGAAPGSWSFDAIEAGAHVVAIDRSALRDDLMQAPNLTFVKTDAFGYRPKAPVDVLVCDVIAYPERNIALLETWLEARLCGAFVVTLKFRGDDDYVKVDACKNILNRLASRYVFRQLYHNKNEVTAAGFCAPGAV